MSWLSLAVVSLLCLQTQLVHSQIYSGTKWEQKAAILKHNTLSEWIEYDITSEPFPSMAQMENIFDKNMSTSLDAVRDDMPNEGPSGRRKKLVHPVGVIAPAQWISENTEYTGLFKGCKNAFIRFSLTVQPEVADPPVYAPGIAIKCFRKGTRSGNVFGMYNLHGQSSPNFFEHDLTSHVPDMGTLIDSPLAGEIKRIRDHFATATNYPVMVGTSDFALADENGKKCRDPAFPFRLVFHPVKAVHERFASSPLGVPFHNVLVDGLQEAGPLYEVWAEEAPNSATLVRIGSLVTTGPAVTSSFGDNYLFFRHIRMEDDLSYYPEWKKAADDILEHQRSVPNFVRQDLPWDQADY